MSVSIRLAKYGKRHAPSYRVVVTKTRTKRSGKSIDIIGFYNPSDSVNQFTIDKNKYEQWVRKGAIVSEAVKNLIAGTYKYVKYVPMKKEIKKEKVPQDDETPQEESKEAQEDQGETKQEDLPKEDEAES